MKYLIVVTDGAGDDPMEKLGGKTPLEVAEMSNINDLAARGEVGTVRTIPPGIAPRQRCRKSVCDGVRSVDLFDRAFSS